jgi:hypothetical protein
VLSNSNAHYFPPLYLIHFFPVYIYLKVLTLSANIHSRRDLIISNPNLKICLLPLTCLISLSLSMSLSVYSRLKELTCRNYKEKLGIQEIRLTPWNISSILSHRSGAAVHGISLYVKGWWSDHEIYE